MNIEDLIKMGVNQKAYPEYLYKYRTDNSFTEKIITENELWFSNPKGFNDPYDCSTPINTNTPFQDIKNWLQNIGIYPGEIDRLAMLLKQNPDLMKDATDKALSKIGVCCFSTMGDSILQWSHYSDYHKGICFKFEIVNDPIFFNLPVVVSYRKIMQHYNHFINASKIIEYLIQPKYYEWAYESEVRIVKPEILIQQNMGNRAFKYKDSCLKEIIFGAKTDSETKIKYKNLCVNNNKQHVKFSQVELDNKVHYNLNIK